MAHLSVLVAEAGQQGMLITVALLFLVVFSIKAGLFLFYWLPGSYSVSPTEIAAILRHYLLRLLYMQLFVPFPLHILP